MHVLQFEAILFFSYALRTRRIVKRSSKVTKMYSQKIRSIFASILEHSLYKVTLTRKVRENWGRIENHL